MRRQARDRSGPTGVVLAGAAALGAYEAGVLHYAVDAVARDVGRARLFDLVSGTSAGAINALALAAFADAPVAGMARLCEVWAQLQLGQVVRPSATELLLLLLDLGGVPARIPRALRIRRARGGLLDPRPITRLLARELPIHRLPAHLQAGLLSGVAISATQVATGRAVVFYQTAAPTPRWKVDEGIVPVPTRLDIVHGVASAAIPLLFPPVSIDGDLYCDGGLRQMVPLSPSLHLGARRLLVINPLARADGEAAVNGRREMMTSPIYLAGKALNALLFDRTEVDLARLAQITGVLQAGRRRFGPTFDREINAELGLAGAPALHEIEALRLDPSRDLGRLAADYAASRKFTAREHGLAAYLIRGLAERGAERSGDLLSYLLFDGGFAAELIALGRADARAHHAELCELFAAPAVARAAPHARPS